LAVTTMEIGLRRLKRIVLEEASEEAERMFTTCMGDRVEPRKELIQIHARNAKLDI
jgi:DNA gyrase subunit B